jgi:hypothetical protein
MTVAFTPRLSARATAPRAPRRPPPAPRPPARPHTSNLDPRGLALSVSGLTPRQAAPDRDCPCSFGDVETGQQVGNPGQRRRRDPAQPHPHPRGHQSRRHPGHDRLRQGQENKQHALVCDRQLSLATAQRRQLVARLQHLPRRHRRTAGRSTTPPRLRRTLATAPPRGATTAPTPTPHITKAPAAPTRSASRSSTSSPGSTVPP